jgi:predicted RNase H-like nuclease (RuvC/YqgF family)
MVDKQKPKQQPKQPQPKTVTELKSEIKTELQSELTRQQSEIAKLQSGFSELKGLLFKHHNEGHSAKLS